MMRLIVAGEGNLRLSTMVQMEVGLRCRAVAASMSAKNWTSWPSWKVVALADRLIRLSETAKIANRGFLGKGWAFCRSSCMVSEIAVDNAK